MHCHECASDCRWLVLSSWHLKKRCRVLQFGAHAYSQHVTVINFIIGIFVWWFCFANHRRHWSDWVFLQVCWPAESVQMCADAERQLFSNHAVWILGQCVPQGEPAQVPAGWGSALSNSITAALPCFPGSKNSGQLWEEQDCHNDWGACVSLCHRLLCGLLCFRLIMKSKQLTGCAEWLALNAVF